MSRKFTRIADQTFECSAGGYFLRIRINGKRTWRKLQSLTPRQAKLEAGKLLATQAQAEAGLTRSPFTTSDILEKIIERYLEAGCPNQRLERRHEGFQAENRYRLQRPLQFFGNMRASQVRIPLLLDYAKWARRRMALRGGTGNRTVDQELKALSQVYRYAMAMGLIDFNPLLGRPRFQVASEVRNCREVAPANADELHRLAAEFFESARSSVLGWQCLLEAFTGCRTSEILRLRMDAKTPEEPGFVEDGHLYIERSKNGVNPYALIHPALAELIRAHHHWHGVRYPHCPWWLPGRGGQGPLDKNALGHGLARICRELVIPHRTSHGLRSYYVTARRGQRTPEGQGIADWQIAAEIGDRTVELIHKTYGDRPANFQGGNRHTWLPSSGNPAWSLWLPENTSVLSMPMATPNSAAL